MMAMAKDQWLDLFQTGALLLIAITQVLIWRAIRDEMRRAAAAVSVMSRAMGEMSDTSRRVEQIEEDLADLTHQVEGRLKPSSEA